MPTHASVAPAVTIRPLLRDQAWQTKLVFRRFHPFPQRTPQLLILLDVFLGKRRARTGASGTAIWSTRTVLRDGGGAKGFCAPDARCSSTRMFRKNILDSPTHASSAGAPAPAGGMWKAQSGRSLLDLSPRDSPPGQGAGESHLGGGWEKETSSVRRPFSGDLAARSPCRRPTSESALLRSAARQTSHQGELAATGPCQGT